MRCCLPSPAKPRLIANFDGLNSVSSGDFARRGSSIGRVVQAVTVGADDVRLMVLVCVARRATATYWNIWEASEELVAWDLADRSLPMVRAVAWQSADTHLFLVWPDLSALNTEHGHTEHTEHGAHRAL